MNLIYLSSNGDATVNTGELNNYFVELMKVRNMYVVFSPLLPELISDKFHALLSDLFV